MVKPLTVTHVGQRGARQSVDITDRVTSLNHWTDAGTGEVASASLMLDCFDGAFLKPVTGVPLLEIYDELRIDVGHTWDTGRHSRTFFVHRLLPQRTSGGAVLTVELLGREDYMREHQAMGQHINATYSSMLTSLCARLSDLGPRQPQFACSATTTPGVPSHAAGSLVLGQGESSTYSLVMRIVERLSQSVSEGGAGDILSLTFTDAPDIVTMHVRSMGGRNADVADRDKPVISTADPDFSSCLPVIEQQELNAVMLRGRPDWGTLPREFSVWRSAIEAWEYYRDYDASASYLEGDRARHGGRVYQRLAHMPGASGVAPTDTAHWREFAFHELLGAGFRYSPWTHGRAQEWQNMASLPQNNRGIDLDSPAYPDGNLSVSDGTITSTDHFRRDWVDYGPLTVASRQATPPSGYGALRDGARVLCAADSTGTDPYGVAYANSIAARVGSRLLVVRPAAAILGGHQVAVLQTGRVWEWHRPPSMSEGDGVRAARSARTGFSGGPLAWHDVSAGPFGNDCFHRPVVIENARGLLPGRSDASGTDYAVGSAIRIVYQETLDSATLGWWNALVSAALGGLGAALAALTGGELEAAGGAGAGAMGWWATLFMAPWPPTSTGGATRGSLWSPPVLDLYNSNVSASGAISPYAAGGEELGETTGIAFLISFDIRLGGADDSPRLGFQGDFPFRIFVYDTEGKVWVKDENVRYLGEAQQIRAYWSEFRPWRARAPLGVTDLVLNWTTPERLELERLNERRVRMVTIQYDRPYDEFGRYNPWGAWDDWLRAAVQGAGTIRHSATIDALHLMKHEHAVERHGSDRLVADPVEVHDGISNSLQLRNAATASLDVGRRRVPAYSITTAGRLDIRLDDTIFYHDALLERSSDRPAAPPATGGEPGTRRLVVTRLQHSYTPAEGWKTQVTAIDRVKD